MRWGNKTILITAVAIAVCGLGYWLTRPKEPEYQGHSLTYWVDRRWTTDDRVKEESEQALRAMGTNAVPHLIRMLGGKDGPWTLRIQGLAGKMPSKLSRPLSFRMTRDQRAAMALEIIGQDAAAAIPALMEKLGDCSWLNLPPFASALTKMGPQAADPLAKALFDPDERVRQCAIFALSYSETNAISALPEVKRFIATSTNDAERSQAVLVVEYIQSGKPGLMVPFLLECLNDKAPEVRGRAADLLGSYPKDAKAAVPRLIWLSQNDVPDVRKIATDTLKEIEKVSVLP